MDEIERRIVNELQGGFPLCERPFAEAAARLAMSEGDLLSRLRDLLANNTLTRFGPLFDAERLGAPFRFAR